jgi:hypothetical protein
LNLRFLLTQCDLLKENQNMSFTHRRFPLIYNVGAEHRYVIHIHVSSSYSPTLNVSPLLPVLSLCILTNIDINLQSYKFNSIQSPKISQTCRRPQIPDSWTLNREGRIPNTKGQKCFKIKSQLLPKMQN